jgi:hypothetical protein
LITDGVVVASELVPLLEPPDDPQPEASTIAQQERRTLEAAFGALLGGFTRVTISHGAERCGGRLGRSRARRCLALHLDWPLR